MSLKMSEKATSADPMEQQHIIKFCVDLIKTPIKTKQMMKEQEKH